MNLRLNTLAEMVDQNSRVADIGTDHAYLPIQLVKEGKVDYAIASDIAQGPLNNAIQDIAQAGFADKIEARLGAGLETIKHEDQIDTVVIAGMGGKLMIQILDDAWNKGFHFENLVLAPNITEPKVREWLMNHNYHLLDEKLIFEAGHSYELLKAKLEKEPVELTKRQLLFGPIILKDKSPEFYQKWASQLNYFNGLLANLNKAKNKDQARIESIEQQIAAIKEELDD
ncbi:S-adenosyl-L-methionine-dependent methyltransferase [Lactobacillus pasteurii DSM 23907 = CRBIP 24.76]|uniref:Possible S-adenosyl-L-methionine-dependent methyltransferase n=1 Tax=Lactobacillus pasteurii DSM 23907 = CRBIP 24.76 TaxID=1423790 RepID=I7LE95_9LACO|nr:class I SAM-dependent methyltransferase [Lactobacillus pasteurii]KRK08539.1 S-adenosyl-L-methionine-dependent methyltransferase [Lactobacillus pasteurii DSM 23907 = CRBIP 24.76]TDG75718.1 hypothetical protein C5L33_000603 [Lactobacillus pasteurii]CCI85598.1 Possible S-adenosyl-L-methionine-dependent methyltransferase [Lactobacillus pasteurii DSM 23907 = CRBIP 24.76]